MRKSIGVAVFVSALIVAGAVAAQGMLLDAASDKVIKKYQAATCDQLKAQKNEPPSEKEKTAVEFLRNDSQARVAFINKIAAPVLNKMFECGMIP
jgi:replication initiation and membrane attachment protein DnaB